MPDPPPRPLDPHPQQILFVLQFVEEQAFVRAARQFPERAQRHIEVLHQTGGRSACAGPVEKNAVRSVRRSGRKGLDPSERDQTGFHPVLAHEAISGRANGFVRKGAGSVGLLRRTLQRATPEDLLLPHDSALTGGQSPITAVLGSGATPTPLSPREQQIVELLARGHTNKEIAGRLGWTCSRSIICCASGGAAVIPPNWWHGRYGRKAMRSTFGWQPIKAGR
jgi:hypothetical protein